MVRYFCISGGQINGTVNGKDLDGMTGEIRKFIGKGRESNEDLRLAETENVEQIRDL